VSEEKLVRKHSHLHRLRTPYYSRCVAGILHRRCLLHTLTVILAPEPSHVPRTRRKPAALLPPT